MRTIPALLVAALVVANASGPALAQTMAANAMIPGGAISPTGPLLSTPSAVINVVDNGAKCNTNVNSPSSGTDDTAAINAAIARWKAALAVGPATLVFPRGGLACKITGPLNFTNANTEGAVVDGLNVFASFSPNGPVGTLGTITAGSGGTSGTYTGGGAGILMTGGTGSGCRASSITVGGGGVTGVTIATPGCGTGYALGDTLSVASANIGGVTGFSVPVASISGRAAVDAMGARWIDWRDIYIQGDCASASTMPNVGMAIGRVGGVADVHEFDHPVITGCFQLANFYNLDSETDTWIHPEFYNDNPSGISYALVQDGQNYWNWSSSFVTETLAVGMLASFNENTFISADFRDYTSVNGRGVWMLNTHRHRYVGSYIAAYQYAAVLYDMNTGYDNQALDFDTHIEISNVDSCFFLTGGNPNPVLQDLTYRDHGSECTNYFFKTDAGISSVSAPNLKIDVSAADAGLAAVSNPSLWTASGSVYVPAPANWNLSTSEFQGTVNIGGAVTQSGSGTFSSLGAGLAQNAGVLSATYPSPFPVNSVLASGSVASATNNNYWCYRAAAGGAAFPTITMTAPPSGGTQAVVTGASSQLICALPGSNIVSGGTNYQVGDTVTLAGATCATTPAYVVATVNGSGVVQTLTGNNGGAGCTSLPAEPVAVTGGHGAGLTLQNLGWATTTFNVTAAGSGYVAAPTGTFSNNASATNIVGSGTVSTTLNSAFTATGGGFTSLTLNAAGAQLGVAGASGVPAFNQGALIDATGVRVALTTSGYTVPANSDLVRFTQPSTISSATVTLPTALADGQPIQFVNYAGAVTALTFSPAVAGWTNGATLAANTGVRIRWDATAVAWQREQ